jgi:hypothetical protein
MTDEKTRLKMVNNKYALMLGACIACASFSPITLAAPDEIQVYTEEMNDPGEYGVELHVNYVIEGAKVPSYEGESPSHHMFQATPEFSYGITRNWEAGMYVPVAREENGNLYGNGLRLRMKYMATPAAGSSVFMGLNTEIGYSNSRVSESEWGMELRPIIGIRTEDWLLSFNPILNMDLSNNASHQPQFEPALKVSRKVAEGVHAGLEYYGEYGYTNNILPESQRINYLYAAVDIAKHDFDINFGIGRGDSNASDSWIAKAIIAFPFK